MNITLSIYGHVTPRMQDTAITEMNDLLHLEGLGEEEK